MMTFNQGRTPAQQDSHITEAELVVQAIALLLICGWIWGMVT